MRWCIAASFLLLGAACDPHVLNSAAPAQFPLIKCDASPLVRAEPPPDPNADPFGEGPWYINERRTIWAGWDAGRWHAGRNKALWIRPAGTALKIDGERLDAQAPPLRADIPCCYPTGFQATALIFPNAGCWRVHAAAGSEELTFVTNVSDVPPLP